MNNQEQQYLDLLNKLLSSPTKPDRTGTGTHVIFSHQMRFNLQEGFPLLTTKKVHFKSIVVELLWFLKGDTNIKYLLENGCTIWTEWRYKEYLASVKHDAEITPVTPITQKEFEARIIADPIFADIYGDIGKGYGHQWRNFGEVEGFSYYNDYRQLRQYDGVKGFDQISWVINEIKTNPNSRRLIVSGWNPHEVNKVDLPPCHTLFQFFVQNGKLSCQLYQRSADTFLGVPFNIASYALLTHLIANECGLGVGEFIWSGGDVHLYSNHVEQAKEQISRTTYDFPQLKLDLKDKSIFDLNPEDIDVVNYKHHPAIKAKVAV